MEDIDAATLEDVEAFFRTYYAPNNAVLTLCGDFDRDEALALVQRYFGPIPRGPEIPPLPGRPEIASRLEAEVRETVTSAIALPRVYLAFRIPAYGQDDFFPGDVTANLLATGKSSRLYRALVREKRLAQSVIAFAFPIVTGSAMLVIWATANPGVEVAKLEQALWTELEPLATNPQPDEIARAVTGIESRQLIALQRVGDRADQLSMFATLFGEPERINTELDSYRAVTAEDVRRFALEYLRRDSAAVLTYLPETDRVDT
ncbi:MAG: insulinase family protein [Gemmatimonadetes bacterium]|nr:insulinase family protein [Gemmatimonadota bacterium]